MTAPPAVPEVTPKPGIYPGVPYRSYASWDAVNGSLLKLFARSPAHAREEMLHPGDPTDALLFGGAVHAALLEPDAFPTLYGCGPEDDKRTKAGRAAWEEWERANPRAQALKPYQWNAALRMRDAVYQHGPARALLLARGANEVSMLWRDADLDVSLKGRVDRLTEWSERDADGRTLTWPAIVDLKTCEDAGPREFSRAVDRFRYHEQAALYLDGAAALAPRNRRFFFIAVEKSPPFAVAVYELEEAALEQGREDFRRALASFVECKARDVWPGYPETLQMIGLPPWAYRPLGG